MPPDLRTGEIFLVVLEPGKAWQLICWSCLNMSIGETIRGVLLKKEAFDEARKVSA